MTQSSVAQSDPTAMLLAQLQQMQAALDQLQKQQAANHVPDEITENYKLNRLIVLGLLLIAILVVAGSAAVFATTRTVSSELILIISNICSGLLGFLSRGFRTSGTGSKLSNVNADSGSTVNVQSDTQPEVISPNPTNRLTMPNRIPGDPAPQGGI